MELRKRDPSDIVDDTFTGRVLGCAISVQRQVGVGLLENAYEVFLAHELTKKGFGVRRQVGLPATYDGITVELSYVADLIVDDRLIIEVKAVTKILGVHESQLITYLRLSQIKVGLLINFHAMPLMSGVKRLVV